MNQKWYQSAVDLMLSRSEWHVFELAEKFTKLVDPIDPIQPNFHTWFTTLFIAGDRGNKPGENILKTEHIIESLLDPDFRTDILNKFPQGAVFPSWNKMIIAIQQSDYLAYFPEVIINPALQTISATISNPNPETNDRETIMSSEALYLERLNKILQRYPNQKKYVSRFPIICDLQVEHGEMVRGWTEAKWFKQCYKAKPELFVDSAGHQLGVEGFHSFWLWANPLRNELFNLNSTDFNREFN